MKKFSLLILLVTLGALLAGCMNQGGSLPAFPTATEAPSTGISVCTGKIKDTPYALRAGDPMMVEGQKMICGSDGQLYETNAAATVPAPAAEGPSATEAPADPAQQVVVNTQANAQANAQTDTTVLVATVLSQPQQIAELTALVTKQQQQLEAYGQQQQTAPVNPTWPFGQNPQFNWTPPVVPNDLYGGTPRAMPGGFTSCPDLEHEMLATLPKAFNINNMGSEQNPIDYTKFAGAYHDLCFGWTNYGSGLKHVIVSGPAVLQVGEGCRHNGVIYLEAGQTYKGCINAGWKYVNQEAVDAQWKLVDGKVVLESEGGKLMGHICGYKLQTMVEDTWAYRWFAQQLVRAPDLECPYTLEQLQAIKDGTASQAPGSPAAAPATGTDYGQPPYIQFKVVGPDGTPYCGFRAKSSKFPKGTNVIEDFVEYPKDDLGFAQATDEWGMTSDAGFCKPSQGKTWVTVFLTVDGMFVPITYPLPK